MLQSHEFRFDVASAVSQGQRDYQEDAIASDFPLGSNLGFVVLADGMGGHSAGDIASKIVVTEVYSELKIQSGDAEAFQTSARDILIDAARSANACVKGHVNAHPETNGMGTTLIAPVFVRNQLFWVSVGDSPLYLFRDQELTQLNEDHSMAPQIDLMASTGVIDEEQARNHPDRNCLTSVLIGNEIARIDCPETPVALRNGDIVVVASDGVQFLTDEEIEALIAEHAEKPASEIAQVLLNELAALGDPDQDNITFSVVKISAPESTVTEMPPPALTAQPEQPEFRTTRMDAGEPAPEQPNLFKPLQFLKRAAGTRSDAI